MNPSEHFQPAKKGLGRLKAVENPGMAGFRLWMPILAALVLVAYGPLPASGQVQPPAAPRNTQLQIVFSRSVFRTANRNDATAAARVWAKLIGRRKGFEVEPSVDIVSDVGEIRRRVQANEVGILALDAVEYLQLADLVSIEPAFTASRGQTDKPQHYVMLVRSEGGVTSVEALRGKNGFVNANTDANMGQMWIDALLFDARLGSAERFFGTMGVVSKATAAVLPVFFGKADVAVVDASSFAVIKEMNPQVGAKLRVLSASPPVFEGLICLCSKDIEFRKELLEGMRDLHLDAEGRQILMAFQCGRLLPVDNAVVEHVRDLRRKQLLSRRSGEPSRGVPAQAGARAVKSGGAP